MEFDLNHYRRLYDKHKSAKTDEDKNSALANTIAYLDECHISMPLPLYRYKEEDRSTWKYRDSKCHFYSNGKIKVTEVLNSDFRFNEL